MILSRLPQCIELGVESRVFSGDAAVGLAPPLDVITASWSLIVTAVPEIVPLIEPEADCTSDPPDERYATCALPVMWFSDKVNSMKIAQPGEVAGCRRGWWRLPVTMSHAEPLRAKLIHRMQQGPGRR